LVCSNCFFIFNENVLVNINNFEKMLNIKNEMVLNWRSMSLEKWKPSYFIITIHIIPFLYDLKCVDYVKGKPVLLLKFHKLIELFGQIIFFPLVNSVMFHELKGCVLSRCLFKNLLIVIRPIHIITMNFIILLMKFLARSI